MFRVMGRSLALLSVAALTGLVPSRASAEEKPVKPIKEWKGKFVNKTEEPLMNAAPKTGTIADQKAWGTLWKAWRGQEEIPQIDFSKQLVLVGTAGCAANRIDASFTLDDKGDLKGGFRATEIGGPGFVYMIVVIDRAGIKTCNGKAIKTD